MAEVYGPPEGYDFVPSGDWSAWRKEENAYMDKLRDWCKQNSASKNPLVGETIKTPVGDGYAVYMIFDTRPFELIHVPVGDAWHADAVWVRGLRLSDAKKMVENDKAMAKLFGRAER